MKENDVPDFYFKLKELAELTGLYVLMADLGNDHKEFHGVYGSQELADKAVEELNAAYSGKVAYWEKVELNEKFS